mmetsp:Transcript_3396/g.11150  ORF Transcript_3396/g.11150 Transcript_3396/m.11150 type:complete len:229 (-) Transcript_3396:1055-1741(-)
MLATARMVFAIAAKHGTTVHHADIPQAFLQENVSRPIFVTTPKGVSVKSHILDAFRKQNPRGKVRFRLIKSLYGLASSPHLFSKMLNNFLVKLGMQRSRTDCTLYTYHDKTTGKWCILTAFVDDLLITVTDDEFKLTLKNALFSRFGADMTWNERVSSFLGLHVDQSADNYRITLSARHKIDELFKKVNEGHEHNLQWHPLKAPYSSEFQNAKDYPNTPLSMTGSPTR